MNAVPGPTATGARAWDCRLIAASSAPEVGASVNGRRLTARVAALEDPGRLLRYSMSARGSSELLPALARAHGPLDRLVD